MSSSAPAPGKRPQQPAYASPPRALGSLRPRLPRYWRFREVRPQAAPAMARASSRWPKDRKSTNHVAPSTHSACAATATADSFTCSNSSKRCRLAHDSRTASDRHSAHCTQAPRLSAARERRARVPRLLTEPARHACLERFNPPQRATATVCKPSGPTLWWRRARLGAPCRAHAPAALEADEVTRGRKVKLQHAGVAVT